MWSLDALKLLSSIFLYYQRIQLLHVMWKMLSKSILVPFSSLFWETALQPVLFFSQHHIRLISIKYKNKNKFHLHFLNPSISCPSAAFVPIHQPQTCNVSHHVTSTVMRHFVWNLTFNRTSTYTLCCDIISLMSHLTPAIMSNICS